MLASWVQETTTTTGTGDLALSAVSGYPRFSDVFPFGSAAADLNGSQIYYAILDDATGKPIELGGGVLINSGNTLVRVRPVWTYTSGTLNKVSPSAVSLAAGTKRVICADAHWARVLAPQHRIVEQPDRLSGHFCSRGNGATGESTDGPGQLRLEAYLHLGGHAVSAFGCRVVTAQAGGAARMGLYAVARDVNYPVGKLLAESGEFDCSSTGVKTSAVAGGDVMIAPGWYWLVRWNKIDATGYRSYNGAWLGGYGWVHDFGHTNNAYKTVAYSTAMPSLLLSVVTQATPGDSSFVGFLRLAY